MDAQNEAYVKARDEFWRAQSNKKAFNWAKWSKIFWITLAITLLVSLAAAGAPWILILVPAALVLAATWKIWAGIFLIGLL